MPPIIVSASELKSVAVVPPAFPRVVAFGGDEGLRRTLARLVTMVGQSGAPDVHDRLTAVVNGREACQTRTGHRSAFGEAAFLPATTADAAAKSAFGAEHPRRRLTVTGPARPEPELLKRIVNADLIVVGPGRLYSDILPALLVGGIAPTLSRLRAVRVYVANLLTEPGDTADFTVADCLAAIREHARANLFDFVLVNRRAPDPAGAAVFGVKGERPMAKGPIDDHDLVVIEEDLADSDDQGRLVHSPVKLASVLLRLAGQARHRHQMRVLPGGTHGQAVTRKCAPPAAAEASYARMITGPVSFWTAVHAPFMRHDLTRADVREVVRHGLARTGGSYRLLAELFNLIPADYERFLTFLHEYDCDVCSLPFSSSQRLDPAPMDAAVVIPHNGISGG
jgi:2-phospho-L-lactate transferase CofD